MLPPPPPPPPLPPLRASLLVPLPSRASRAQAGKPPLGFLNPLLYASAHAFNDITKVEISRASGAVALL